MRQLSKFLLIHLGVLAAGLSTAKGETLPTQACERHEVNPEAFWGPLNANPNNWRPGDVVTFILDTLPLDMHQKAAPFLAKLSYDSETETTVTLKNVFQLIPDQLPSGGGQSSEPVTLFYTYKKHDPQTLPEIHDSNGQPVEWSIHSDPVLTCSRSLNADDSYQVQVNGVYRGNQVRLEKLQAQRTSGEQDDMMIWLDTTTNSLVKAWQGYVSATMPLNIDHPIGGANRFQVFISRFHVETVTRVEH